MKFFLKFLLLPALASILIIGVVTLAYPQKVKEQLINFRDYVRGIEYNKFEPSTDVIWGIDISHHQQQIAWDEMQQSKPHFIFLKATEGTTHRDTRYQEYRKKAGEKGIVTGAYHFFSYKTSGRDQAKNFLEFANLKKGDLPPVLDVEFTSNMPKASYVKQQIAEFLNYVEKETGIKSIIYCECDYYNKYLKNGLNDNYEFWISDFWRQPRCDFTFWQKTDKFKHPAFKGTIDYNVFNGSLEELESFTIK